MDAIPQRSWVNGAIFTLQIRNDTLNTLNSQVTQKNSPNCLKTSSDHSVPSLLGLQIINFYRESQESPSEIFLPIQVSIAFSTTAS